MTQYTSTVTGAKPLKESPYLMATSPENEQAASQQSTLATLKGLLPFLQPYRKQFALAGIALLVAAMATLTIPYAFRQMIDLGFSKIGDGEQWHTTCQSDFSCAVWRRGSFGDRHGSSRFYMVSWLGERVTADIRNAVYSHVVNQSPEFFETTQTGEVLSRLTTDTTLIQTVVGTSISLALRNFLVVPRRFDHVVCDQPYAVVYHHSDACFGRGFPSSSSGAVYASYRATHKTVSRMPPQ